MKIARTVLNGESGSNATDLHATVTDVKTGKPEYLQVKSVLRDMEMLRASAFDAVYIKACYNRRQSVS